MRTFAAWSLVALLSLPAVAGCFGPQQGPWNLTLTLGAILPGAGEASAGDLRVAFNTAVAQVNTANVGLKVTTVFDSASGGDAAAAYDRLVQRGAVAVVDLRGGVEAQSVVQRAASTPLVLPAIENASLTGTTYRIAPDPALEARAVSALAQRVAPSGAMVVVGRSGDPYGALVAQQLTGAQFLSDTGNGAIGGAVCAAHPASLVVLTGPAEALRILQSVRAAGCRASVKVVGGSQAFGMQPVTPDDVTLAQGVVGVAPEGARLALLDSILRTVDTAVPPPFSAETFDAVDYLSLAAIASHGGNGKERLKIEGTVSAADVQANLLRVASSPGAKQHDFASAAQAAKGGDDIDWQGYAHDFDISDNAHSPTSGRYVEWTTVSDGSSEIHTETVVA